MPYSYFSSLKTAFKHGVGRSSIGFESGLQSPLEVFIGQGKLLLGNSRVFHSVPFASLSELHALIRPGTGFAARSDLQQANQRSNLSVVGAISRTFSTPSVLGPSFQVCEFHIDRLLRSSADSISLLGEKLQNMPMATRSSRALFDKFSVGKVPPKHGDVSVSVISRRDLCVKGSFNIRQNASMSLRKPDQPHNNLVYGYFVYNVARKFCNPNSYLESGLKGFHSSSAASLSSGSVPDVSFENTSRDEVLTNSMASSEQNPSSERTLKLLSGSCYLPHPDKEETGGEDAHFICMDKQAIGVADGVGGWADLGVDSGKYARELMSNSVAAVEEEPKGLVDPARVLEKAHSSTKAKGSSTACIIALTDQGLHAINLGDSGFMVVRDGCTVFRSPVQQHDFNFTYQLESGINGDLPSSGQSFTVTVAPGDVIIAGTDGLFDNLYNNEVTGVVVHAWRAGLGPQVAAQKIAALARERAQDKHRQTPFSTAAQDAGYRYYGGKLDDITVVVSYITSATTEKQSSQSAGCVSS